MNASLTEARTDAPVHLPSPIARLRLALRAALADELSQIAGSQTTVDALTGQTDTDSILEREVAERRQSRARESVVDIRAALDRIEAGTYGGCESCGQLIALERLEAIPFARHCVSCTASAPSFLG